MKANLLECYFGICICKVAAVVNEPNPRSIIRRDDVF